MSILPGAACFCKNNWECFALIGEDTAEGAADIGPVEMCDAAEGVVGGTLSIGMTMGSKRHATA
jgi:hypothetical protein